jgi:hypothetical protein
LLLIDDCRDILCFGGIEKGIEAVFPTRFGLLRCSDPVCESFNSFS